MVIGIVTPLGATTGARYETREHVDRVDPSGEMVREIKDQ